MLREVEKNKAQYSVIKQHLPIEVKSFVKREHTNDSLGNRPYIHARRVACISIGD